MRFTGFDAIEAGHLPVNEYYLVRLATLGALANHLDGFLAGGRLIRDEGHVPQHVRQHRASG